MKNSQTLSGATIGFLIDYSIVALMGAFASKSHGYLGAFGFAILWCLVNAIATIIRVEKAGGK